MIAKEKAKKLVGKYYINIPLRDCDNRRPHKLALIAVDEIIKALRKDLPEIGLGKGYWYNVKQEIEKL